MRNLKHLFCLIIAILFSGYSCYSQEKSHHKCAYQFDILRDTLTKERFRQEIYIVQIGDHVTKGFTYQKFYIDSLRTHNPELEKKLFNISLAKSFEAFHRTGDVSYVRNNSFSYGAFTSDLYKDYGKNEIRVKDNIQRQNFIYKESLLPQDWDILSDTATIAGYHCQKAQCHYRGRDYEAWFTPDIPINEGPWKFYGLPGLIIKLHDTQGHYNFTLIGFQKAEEPISTKISNDTQSISRKEFLQMKFGKIGETMLNMEMAKINLPPEKSENKYDDIERDYKDK